MRIMKLIAPAAVALSLAPATFASAFAGSDPVGVWLDDTGRGAVEIKPCGNALCGNVVWVKSSTDSDGCGKQIIGNVMPVGSGHWDNGWIYSPEKGRKYDVELTPLSNGNLKVVGYAGLKFLSRTMIWKPAPADLQLCTATPSPNNADGSGATNASVPTAITPNANAPGKSAVPPTATSVDANAAAPNTNATADAKKSSASPDQGKTPPKDIAKADEPPPATGNSDTSSSDFGNMKIGGTQLDKLFTKTKDGKCKLDLPWVKVTLDCER